MPQTPEHPIEKPGPEETLEFLKRNEVRTMAKDVALLREQESKKEREKIVSIKPEAPATQKEPSPPLMPARIATQNVAGGPAKEPRFKLPQRPAHFDKVFIRVALILGTTFVLVNIVAFAVWNAKKGEEISPSPLPAEALSEVKGAEANPPAPEPSLVSLFLTLREKEDAQGLTKIPVKDKVPELPFPSQLKEIIQDEFVIFSFVSQDKKRLGFIFQLQNSQGAQEILQQWEPSMEGDLKTLWNIIGQKGDAYVPFFRQTSYQNTLIRFQTFSVKDFGIVYALKGNVLFITSSLESMKAVLPEEKITATPTPTPIPTPTAEIPIVKKCTDGTLYGQCSTNKPKYCENGNLIDNSTKCSSLSSSKSCSTITTESDLGIIDVTTCKLQTKRQINVGVIEFAPQNVVYGTVSYANLKSLSSCPSSCGKTGYSWINGLNASNACHDVINKYSFLDLFNNPASSVSKYVECQSYNIAQSGNETLHSVYYVKDWWEKEAVKYGVTGFSMNVNVEGPYTLSVDPPAAGRWGGEGACNSNLRQFFINEGKNNGVEENNYDIIVYIYLSDWQLSNRGYQGFTSCADQSKLNIFATVPTFVYPDESETIVMLVHEIGHTLGAADYYTSPCHANSKLQACSKDPEGIPEPSKIPKYPQTKACIMSKLIESAAPGLTPPNSLLTPDLAILCDAAAKEIGWK